MALCCVLSFSPLNFQKIAQTLEIERTHVPLTLLTSLARAIFPPDSRQSKEESWLNNKIFVVLPKIKIKKSHISWAKIGPYRTWSFVSGFDFTLQFYSTPTYLIKNKILERKWCIWLDEWKVCCFFFQCAQFYAPFWILCIKREVFCVLRPCPLQWVYSLIPWILRNKVFLHVCLRFCNLSIHEML